MFDGFSSSAFHAEHTQVLEIKHHGLVEVHFLGQPLVYFGSLSKIGHAGNISTLDRPS